MFSIFKKKTVIPHVRLTGVIGSVGRFKQGIDLAGQREILKRAFSYKKPKTVAISINSPGGSPVQSHLIYSYIKQLSNSEEAKDLVSKILVTNPDERLTLDGLQNHEWMQGPVVKPAPKGSAAFPGAVTAKATATVGEETLPSTFTPEVSKNVGFTKSFTTRST